MFDIKADTFTVKIISGADKSCTLSYPKDEDWSARVRAQRTTRRSLGRKVSEFDVSPTHDFDAKLLEKLRIDKDGASFDPNEATTVIDRLDRTQSLGVEREGNSFRVTMRVHGGSKVVHVLNIPSQKAIDDYVAASGKVRFNGNTSETRSFLEPSGILYDAMFVSAEGYVANGVGPKAAIPLNHKAAALTEMLNTISDALSEDDLDPEE